MGTLGWAPALCCVVCWASQAMPHQPQQRFGSSDSPVETAHETVIHPHLRAICMLTSPFMVANKNRYTVFAATTFLCEILSPASLAFPGLSTPLPPTPGALYPLTWCKVSVASYLMTLEGL